MLKVSQAVLQANNDETELVALEIHFKSVITGLFTNALTLAGSEDEWESFIKRIRKHLERARA